MNPVLARLRTLLFNVLAYGLLGLMGIVGAPVVLLSRDLTYRWMKLYARLAFAIARALAGIRVEVRGTVPTGAVVIAAKHQSMLDVLMLFDALPRAKFVMKRELLWTPVFGQYVWRTGAVAVNRKAGGQGGLVISRMGAQKDEAGQIVLYPQATRVRPGASAPYKRGAAVVAREFGLPVVPAATNTGWFWSRDGRISGPGTAVVEFLDPMPVPTDADQAIREIEAVVEAASDRLAEEARRDLGLADAVVPTREEVG